MSETLRLDLAGRWEPQDYLAAISAIERIYYVTVFHREFEDLVRSFRYQEKPPQRYPRSSNDPLMDFISASRALADDRQRLVVLRVSHASPGFMDFEGLGDVARAVDRALKRIIALFTERKLRREWDEQEAVKTEMMRENLNSLKIDNARKLLELDRDFPGAIRRRHQLELALVEEQGKIEDLASRGMITGPQEHPEEK